jgi:hypothetical protein
MTSFMGCIPTIVIDYPTPDTRGAVPGGGDSK